jgi:hypothetical protein
MRTYILLMAVAILALVSAPSDLGAPLYPGLFLPKTLLFAWGKGTELYAAREKTADAAGKVTPQTILRINTMKSGAPYYGRQ